MPDLHELLTAEADRHRPPTVPPFERVAARARRRRTTRYAAVAASTSAIVMAVFAATTLGDRPDADLPEPMASPKWTIAIACPGWSADPLHSVPEIHLPPDFGPITNAFFCSTTRMIVPGDGEWLFQEARRITGGLDELLDVYARPDERPTSDATGGEACVLAITAVQPIWLHGSSVIAVRPPIGRCGNPIRGVGTALRQLTTEVIVSEPIRQVTSPLSLESGCDQETENFMTNRDYDSTIEPPVAAPEPLPLKPHLVCTFRQSPDGDWLLAAAARFEPAQVARFNSALQTSHIDPACQRGSETMFTVLYLADEDGEFGTYVAVDGCAVQQRGSYWRASDVLRALLPRPG